MPEFTVTETGHRWYPRPTNITEWKAGRKDYLGASEVAAIMGVNPYMTAYDVWLSKTGRTSPPTEDDNLRLFMGREMEEPIAKWYSLQEHREVYDDKRIWVHPRLPFLRCNLDRIPKPNELDIAEGNTIGRIAECKSVGLLAKNRWIRGFPEQYFVQVEVQLMCSPYPAADLAVVVGGNMDYLVFPILPDKAIHDLIESEVTTFWKYVEENIEPPLKAVDLSKVASVSDAAIEADTPTILDHQTAVRLKREVKGLEDQLDTVQSRIVEFVGKREILTYRGIPIFTHKQQDGRKTIDSKKLEKEQPTIYSQYLKVGAPFRVARLKEVEFDVQRDEHDSITDSTSGERQPDGGVGATVGGEAVAGVPRQQE